MSICMILAVTLGLGTSLGYQPLHKEEGLVPQTTSEHHIFEKDATATVTHVKCPNLRH